jgi:hypothetical protein
VAASVSTQACSVSGSASKAFCGGCHAASCRAGQPPWPADQQEDGRCAQSDHQPGVLPHPLPQVERSAHLLDGRLDLGAPRRDL